MARFDLSHYEVKPDEEFDLSQYEVKTPEIDDTFERASIEQDGNNQGDWSYYLKNAPVKAIAEIPDIIANVPELVENSINASSDLSANLIRRKKGKDWIKNPTGTEANYFSEENIGRPSNVIKPIFRKIGFDTEVEPANKEQAIVGNAIDFALPASLWAKLVRGQKLLQASKMAGIGGIQGVSSGVAQHYGGLDPLVADLAAGHIEPRSFMNRFSKTGRALAKEKKVRKLLEDNTKEDDLTKLHNFKPDFDDVIPVTAEVAQVPGFSRLHQDTIDFFPKIQNKQKTNDAILREKLNSIGEELTPSRNELGTSIREITTKKLKKLKKLRSKEADPLYEALRNDEGFYPVENFESYVDSEIPYHVGKIKQNLIEKKNILPSSLEEAEKELAALKKNVSLDLGNTDNLSPKIKEQILKDPTLLRIEELKAEISKLKEKKYKPSHIDSLKSSLADEAFNEQGTMQHHNNKAAEALKKDLELTPLGIKHREVYTKRSKPINQIEEDAFFSEVIRRDKIKITK
jgi:hypothetical protein